jgi:hypothetical protein
VRRTALIVVLACTAAAGCGGGGDYANKPRPASPINVTSSINTDKISISPKTFGAGTIVLTVSNQTPAAQTLTLQTQELGGNKPGIKQTAGPINPRATATLKVDLAQGTYGVSVKGGRISPATLKVGAPRKSAQQELLQP